MSIADCGQLLRVVAGASGVQAGFMVVNALGHFDVLREALTAARLGAAVMAHAHTGADQVLGHVLCHTAATVHDGVASAALAAFGARYIAHLTAAGVDVQAALARMYGLLLRMAVSAPDGSQAAFVKRFLGEAAQYQGLLPGANLALPEWFVCLRRMRAHHLAPALCDMSHRPTRALLAAYWCAHDPF